MAMIRNHNPYGFIARQSADELKTDLELIHDECGAVVCDIEVGDNLAALMMCAEHHKCPEVRS